MRLKGQHLLSGVTEKRTHRGSPGLVNGPVPLSLCPDPQMTTQMTIPHVRSPSFHYPRSSQGPGALGLGEENTLRHQSVTR